MPEPIIWSPNALCLKTKNQGLEKNDLIFLYNKGFDKCFIKKAGIGPWFKNVLQHFSGDELELALPLLSSKLNFLAKKHRAIA